MTGTSGSLHFSRYMAVRALMCVLAVLCAGFGISAPVFAQTVTTYSNTTASAANGVNETATPCATPLIRTFTVGTSYSVGDVDIAVLLAHTYRGDLVMTLQSPSGTRVTFNNQTGGGADNYNAIVSDQAASGLGVDTANHTVTGAASAPPYQFTRSGSALLSAFDGQNASGTWQLEICDNANADSGTFYRADLIITSAPVVTGADLSLTKTVSNATPAAGSSVSWTLTVRNAANSSLAATGVQVRDILPAGFTFTSATGTGSYNSGTGIWTVGTVAIGGTATLTINGTVSASAGNPVTNVAEISASGVSDPDSTPNNGNSSEDDYATRTFVVAGSRLAGTPPAFSCPALQTNVDWDGQAWAAGSLNNNYTITNLGVVNFALTNQGSWTNNATYGGQSPTRQNVVTGGIAVPEFSIFQLIDFGSVSQVSTTTITLPVAVTAARFTIFDVDYNAGQFADRIRVTASYNGGSVPVTLTNGVSNYVVGNQAFGDVTSADTSANGNVVVTIAQPVDTIVIEYGNHALAPADPGGQAIALHDIIMCQPNGTIVMDKSSQIVSVPAAAGTDPFHIPGAVVRYCLLLTNTGSATATNTAISDTLPATVTYNPGTLRYGPTCANATSMEDDDAAGGDEAPEGAAFNAGVVTGTVGSLQGGTSRALTFDVTVN
jgi:uncharacterized repeat protein (TIGR01451 family)